MRAKRERERCEHRSNDRSLAMAKERGEREKRRPPLNERTNGTTHRVGGEERKGEVQMIG